jgi:hypothetical protein
MIFGIAAVVASCTPQQVAEAVPTSTLAPLVTLTPRATATPAVSRTPLPTRTLTPSITPIPPTTTNTHTPSPTPPIMGIISSLETVNVRVGPGANFSAFEALIPGTEVQVIGQDDSGRWLNVRLEDGREGWINFPLVRIEPTSTIFPSITPPPDQTAMAEGSPFPTALIGGGTVTPTPPGPVVATPTEGLDLPEMPATSTTEGEQGGTPVIPVINFDPINATSTALAAILGTPVPTAGSTLGSIDVTPVSVTETNQPIPTNSGPVSAPTTSGEPVIQRGVDLYVNCDAPPRASLRAPSNLAAGSTAEIWWYWYARTEQQITDHLASAVYEIKINGQSVRSPMDYAQPVRQTGDYVVDFFYPTGELAAGTYKVEYRVTWRQQIYDGYNFFGPGTNTLEETGTCTFVVR